MPNYLDETQRALNFYVEKFNTIIRMLTEAIPCDDNLDSRIAMCGNEQDHITLLRVDALHAFGSGSLPVNDFYAIKYKAKQAEILQNALSQMVDLWEGEEDA